MPTLRAWGSGIYGCIPDAVLPVLHRACVPTHRLTPEDRPWIIERPTDFI